MPEQQAHNVTLVQNGCLKTSATKEDIDEDIDNALDFFDVDEIADLIALMHKTSFWKTISLQYRCKKGNEPNH
jgi:hypothetical protein